jgi:hypothetical protein
VTLIRVFQDRQRLPGTRGDSGGSPLSSCEARCVLHRRLIVGRDPPDFAVPPYFPPRSSAPTTADANPLSTPSLCGPCPIGFAGDGFSCYPCSLTVTVPHRSFSSSPQRSAAVLLYGSAEVPAVAGGFPCSAASGFAFSWTGNNSLGEVIPLSFGNQVGVRKFTHESSEAC